MTGQTYKDYRAEQLRAQRGGRWGALTESAGFRGWVRRVTPQRVRNWVRDPRASARWLGLGWAWRRRGAVELDCGAGLVLHCHPASARTFRLFIDEPDSVAELSDFRAQLTPEARLDDLGAHYGFFTLAALALTGPEARVLAVEPSPAAVDVLGANLWLAPAPVQSGRPGAAVRLDAVAGEARCRGVRAGSSGGRGRRG